MDAANLEIKYAHREVPPRENRACCQDQALHESAFRPAEAKQKKMLYRLYVDHTWIVLN
jgi:hypothetical protein